MNISGIHKEKILPTRNENSLQSNGEFLWSDKWTFEDNVAWFVTANVNMLFCMNMADNQYRVVATLPDYLKGGFRRNSNCIKCDDVIFCMPDTGDCVWCFDLNSTEFRKIEILNPQNVRLMISDYWRCENILWAVSRNLKQIIEIDILRQTVIGYHKIADHKETIIRSTKFGKYIYVVSALKGRIYEFNTEIKEVRILELPDIRSGLSTISIFEDKFWMSGYKKEIYVWNKKNGRIKVLNQFPSNFGVYNFNNKKNEIIDYEEIEYDAPLFLESIIAGNYIWFIPFQANQILYINRDTYEIKTFDIPEEQENIDSLRTRELKCKYVIQYVRKDRYIGLYSVKNMVLFEIDSKELKVEKIFVTIDVNNLEKIISGWCFRESVDGENSLYKKLVLQTIWSNAKKEEIGRKIFSRLLEK